MGLFDSSDTSINIVISAIDQASGVLNTLQGNLQKLKPAFTAMQQIGAAGLAATVAPAIAAVKYYADLGKSTEELSQKTGLSIQGISQLGIALDLTGTSTDALGTAIPILAKNLLSAEGGSKSMIKNFQGIGLSVKDLQGLNMDQVFLKVSAAIEKMPQGVQKIAEIKNLFGRGGSNLSSFFDLTPDQLQTYIDLNNKLGDTLSDKDVKGAATAALAFEELQKAGQGLTILWGQTFAPIVAKLALELVDLMEKVKGFVQTHQTLITNIVVGVAAFSGFLVVVGTTGKMLLDAVKILNFFMGGITSLMGVIVPFFSEVAGGVPIMLALNEAFAANPVLIITIALAALAIGIYELYQHCQAFRDALKDVWTWLQNLWNIISPILMPVLNELWTMIQNLWKNFENMWNQMAPVVDMLGKMVAAAKPVWEILGYVALALIALPFAAVIIAIGLFLAALNLIVNVIAGVVWAVTHVSDVFNDLKITAQDVGAWIDNLSKSIDNFLGKISNATGLTAFANSVKSIAGTVTGGVTSALKAVHLATGGIVSSPTFAMVGESGPEAVIPLSGNSGGLGGALGGNQYVTVQITGTVDERMAQRVGDLIIGKLKRNRQI